MKKRLLIPKERLYRLGIVRDHRRVLHFLNKGDRFIFSILIFLAWRLQRRCRKETSRCLGKGAWFDELFALSSSAMAQSPKLE
ncbi:TPA: hypothetical protein ACVFIV_006672, partial [Pseudomonas aeruginosa]